MDIRKNILEQNSALRSASEPVGETPQKAGFAGMLNQGLQTVNDQQQRASAASEAYEMGATNDIVGVMLERHKSSIGFETTLQVRNKLLSAYRDIMNMPV